MSLPRKRESTIADFLDSRFRGNDAERCPLREEKMSSVFECGHNQMGLRGYWPLVKLPHALRLYI